MAAGPSSAVGIRGGGRTSGAIEGACSTDRPAPWPDLKQTHLWSWSPGTPADARSSGRSTAPAARDTDWNGRHYPYHEMNAYVRPDRHGLRRSSGSRRGREPMVPLLGLATGELGGLLMLGSIHVFLVRLHATWGWEFLLSGSSRIPVRLIPLGSAWGPGSRPLAGVGGSTAFRGPPCSRFGPRPARVRAPPSWALLDPDS